MNITELIEKHAKETAEGGGWIEPKDAFRAQSNNSLTHEWLKESFRKGFSELLEMVKTPVDDSPAYVCESDQRCRSIVIAIDKALEELGK